MLSVVVLTRNEARHVVASLDSVREFADELLVLDSISTDETVAIATAEGARVEQRAFDDYATQRNAALELARGEWVFFIDADERATTELGNEIKAAVAESEQKGTDTALMWVPRRNYIFGKWIQHAGWSPDFQPRVLRRGKAHFDPARKVHELVITTGSERRLREPLTHYNYETLAQFRTKQERYTRAEAEILHVQGTRARPQGLLSMPMREFWRRYITLEGYRDGGHGLALSGLMAYYAFRRQAMLMQMK